MNITKETMGYTVVIEHKSGGSIGTWVPNVNEICKHLKSVLDDDDVYVRIIKIKYKDRMRRK